jgi:hypothetical protein
MATIVNYICDIVKNPGEHTNELVGLIALSVPMVVYKRSYPDTVYAKKLGYGVAGILTLLSFQCVNMSLKLLHQVHTS